MIRLSARGHLTRRELAILGILAFLPLVSVAIRTLALPGVLGSGLEGLRGVGSTLNEWLSLGAVPADQREHILYLLLLPTCAMLVALTRIMLGIRVLGFRSILIAVGFHQSGFVAGLLLIAVVVATVVVVRPHLRRMRLPYYGRVPVILCLVATTMVVAVLIEPWMHWGISWGVAYFPVIVLGMLSEGIARTLDRHSATIAAWRALSTIVLGCLLALLVGMPPLRALMLQFPELVVPQIVAIVLIAEFLDLRLLGHWERRIARSSRTRAEAEAASDRVAVVFRRESVTGRGKARRTPGSVRAIVSALTHAGHRVKTMNEAPSMWRKVRRFFPRRTPADGVAGAVLTVAGAGAHPASVPAVPEMPGVARVGVPFSGHALLEDRLVPWALLRLAGVATPGVQVMTDPDQDLEGLSFPATVRPRFGPERGVRRVENASGLRRAVRAILRSSLRGGRQAALVEECVPGRRIVVALVGNRRLECLPPVEVDEANGARRCPAALDEAVVRRLQRQARAAFRACGCRDYARVDLCLSESGTVWVLGVRTFDALARGGAFARAGEAAGYSFDRLIGRIVAEARARLGGGEARPESMGARSAAEAEPAAEPAMSVR